MDISNRTIHRNHLVCIYSMYSQSYTVFLSCNSTVLFSGGKKENASVTIVPIICFLLSFCSGLGVLRLNSLAKKSLRRGCHSWGFECETVTLSHAVNLVLHKFNWRKKTHTHSLSPLARPRIPSVLSGYSVSWGNEPSLGSKDFFKM